MRVRPDASIRYWQLQGMRNYMEDVCVVVPHLHTGRGDFLVGLFDGHGGRDVADYLAKNIKGAVERRFRKSNDIPRALVDAFADLNKEINALPISYAMGSTALVRVFFRFLFCLFVFVCVDGCVLEFNPSIFALSAHFSCKFSVHFHSFCRVFVFSRAFRKNRSWSCMAM